MTSRWVDERIEDFRSSLPPPHQPSFDKRLKEEIGSLDFEEVEGNIESGYEQERDHLELVAATASGFHQTELADGFESGYQFAITEPLAERNSEYVGDEEVKNADILLVREEPEAVYLCFIECKAGSTAGRDWTNKLHDIEITINNDGYREKLKSQIGVRGKQIRHEQYVVVGKIAHMVSMDYDRIAEDMDIPDNYAFWGIDLGARQLVHMYGNVSHPDLERVVRDNIDTSKVENPINFTYNDHPLIQLKALVQGLISKKQRADDYHPFEFNREEFVNEFDTELQVGFSGRTRETLAGYRIDWLLELGKRIELFTDDTDRLNSSREFRIVFRGKKPTMAKESADEKYFNWKSKERMKEVAFETIRPEFSFTQMRLNDLENTSNIEQSGSNSPNHRS